MAKTVTFNPSALDKMRTGINIVAEAVGKTLGPKGTNVFLDDPVSPKFTNDGASIAHQIVLEDKLENAGAWVARNACSQTNDDAGDGTSTTVVLLKAIIDECLSRPENKTAVMQSLMAAKKQALAELKKQSKPITQKEVINVARISAENESLAQLITEVIGKVGSKAVVTVEDRTDGFESNYKLVQGYEAHVGFASPYFRNDPVKPRAMYTDIAVLCSAKKLGTIQDLKMFEQFEAQKISELVIVAEDIEPTILGIFVATKMSGKMNLLVIKAQGPLLEDIAAATGATVISDETGVTFDNFDVKEHLGEASKIICEEKKTIFTSNAISAKRQAARLDSFAEQNPNQFEAKKLRERAAKLRGGIAVIKIGAHTDAERNYLKDKAEDTIHAVQSALEEGVVAGGGMALYQVAAGLNPKTVGEEVLSKALRAPLRQIISNAGKDYAEVVAGLKEKSFVPMSIGKTHVEQMGYDAKNDKYVDFFKEGILDPHKVEKAALENAIATAALFITTHSTITDYVEPKV